MALVYRYEESPIGSLLLAGQGEELHFLRFAGEKPAPDWRLDEKALGEAAGQLRQYFAGTRRSFDIVLKPTGTDFQQAVWQALREIPYGETRSYGEIAARIGRPKAVRAVGAANGRNPIVILQPCHRVIGQDGTLVGFGGGLPTKKTLLRLEGALPSQASLGITGR